ncbi:hypothetical protein [Streptomyces sp. NBC_01334]|uniref:hypothetical protein n=1 Tax=Streptomyces sp. NBC_01334 TaxID=2903827 RepID=UPI002E110564|nr:hypothetical protein OG736_29580 [Streptomyces sp. NBC_01334]
MAILTINAVFESAVEQLDRERRRLDSLDRAEGASPHAATKFDHEGFSAINRALSYVVMGGVLEELMRQLPAALAADVLSLGIERRHLPASLVAAMDSVTFRKCGNDNVSSLIERAGIVQTVLSHEQDSRPVLDFGDLFKLADGQTIGEKHFQALWMILGLQGDWKNDPNDSLLLKEIKSKRNNVAHWTEDPAVIGRSKRPADLRQMIHRLSELIQHFHLGVWYWLEGRKPNTP